MVKASSEIYGDDRPQRLWLPSWAISGLLHLATLGLLGLSLRFQTPGAASEPGRTVGLVLRDAGQSDDPFEGDATSDAPAADSSTPAPLAELFEEPAAIDPTESLPRAEALIGPGPAVGEPSAGARDLAADGDQSQGGGAADGRGSTRVFGLTGTGFKFVYVFDRSGSMGGSGRSALAAAKQELLASLDSLRSNHQFQIVFYNDEPELFRIDDRDWRLVFATDANKALARQFIQTVKADGATQHERALSLALRLVPDVIFFLTDADQPVLTNTQLQRIADQNSAQASINTIEFGLGPSLTESNFLTQLAGQNGGEHVYIDVSGLVRSNGPESPPAAAPGAP